MRTAFLLILYAAFRAADALDDQVIMQLALEGDDQCLSENSQEECALKALQMATAKTFEEQETEGKDISTEFFNKANMSLLALQPHIVKVWNDLQVQNKRVLAVMDAMENATNHSVVWNAGYKPTKITGRRRRRSVGKRLPKRTKYIMYLTVAIQKEMAKFWDTYALVDRKRIGVLNELEIYPYGPNSVPKTEASAIEMLQESDEEDLTDQSVYDFAAQEEGEAQDESDENYEDDGEEEAALLEDDSSPTPIQKTNKKMIEDSFASLISEIKDAQNKTQNLTAKMDSSLSKARAWLAK